MDKTKKRARGGGAGMSKFWQRAFVFAAAFLLLLFASNDFGLIDIQKTAIVLALGVDASAQEGLLDVTAQIGSADANGAAQASNITVEGVSTVGEAIACLNRRTGWYPTFVHCRLLLLGGQTAERDVFGILDYFLRSEYIEDSCLVALCAGRAQAALEAGAPGGELTANAIAKVFSGEAQKTGLVSAVSLREFAKGYYGTGASGRLPYLTLLQEAESGPPQGSGQGAASAFAPGSASAAASASASGLASAAASVSASGLDSAVASTSVLEGDGFASASGGSQPCGALAEGKKGALTPCTSSGGGQGGSGIGVDMLSSRAAGRAVRARAGRKCSTYRRRRCLRAAKRWACCVQAKRSPSTSPRSLPTSPTPPCACRKRGRRSSISSRCASKAKKRNCA